MLFRNKFKCIKKLQKEHVKYLEFLSLFLSLSFSLVLWLSLSLSLSPLLHFHISHMNDTITPFLLDYTTDNSYIIYICYSNKLIFLRVFITVILIITQQELGHSFTLYNNIKVRLIFKLLSTLLYYYELDKIKAPFCSFIWIFFLSSPMKVCKFH